jgi:hypothetical protein
MQSAPVKDLPVVQVVKNLPAQSRGLSRLTYVREWQRTVHTNPVDPLKRGRGVRLVNPLEYIETPRPDITWLAEGLIPKPGYLLLLGPPKVGKSFLAWDWASRIASGRDVLGAKVSKPGVVLYIQLDTKEAAWRTRLQTLASAGYDLNIPNLKFVHPDDMMMPLLVTTRTGYDFLKDAISTAGPDLVIIDVLRELHQEDENDSTAIKRVFDVLESLFAGLSVILIHHTRKMSDEDKDNPDPSVLARGSSYITGRVDGYWLLYGNSPKRKLYFESRFREASVQNVVQDSVGIFTFPDIERDDLGRQRLAGLRIEFPKTQPDLLWKIASERWGYTRAQFYRLLRLPLPHELSIPLHQTNSVSATVCLNT